MERKEKKRKEGKGENILEDTALAGGVLLKAGVVDSHGIADRAPGLVLDQGVARVDVEGRASHEGAGSTDEGEDERGSLQEDGKSVMCISLAYPVGRSRP